MHQDRIKDGYNRKSRFQQLNTLVLVFTEKIVGVEAER